MVPNERLIEQMRQGNLIAFLGAGVSLPYSDPISGNHYPGLAAAGELVEKLAAERSYINKEMPFHEACFIYKQKEGRSSLEAFLAKHLDRPTLKPLPAHYMIAALPFSAIITTNFDTLIEAALRNTKKIPWPVFRDQHVAGLRPTHSPVIKIHGCITDRSTIVAAADDYVSFGSVKPIIDSLLKVQLANRTALFMGFGLKDHNFVTVYRSVKDQLKDHMPRSFAVVQSASDFEKEYWKSLGVEIICADLTQFLHDLGESNRTSSIPSVWSQSEDWTNSVFFSSLQSIRTLPSETQVIDAFLKHFLERLEAPGLTVSTVADEAKQAIDAVRNSKPNYRAFFAVADNAISSVNCTPMGKDSAQSAVQDVIRQRALIGQSLQAKGRSVVNRQDTLLLYSQSKRVIELLRGVPKNIQASCQIFVAECRPKSPYAFTDALAIVEAMTGTAYEFSLIPDAAIGYVLEKRQVSKVLMGAHQIYRKNGAIEGIINSSGSGALVMLAERHRIPIYVIAEDAKITDLAPNAPAPVPSYIPEEALFESIDQRLTDLKAMGTHIQGVNIGYDLCSFSAPPFIVTES